MAAVRKAVNIMKILNVAEKNDAAKSIAAIMSRNSATRREGFSKYNKIYQFDYMLRQQPVTMVMTSVSGHLQDMDFIGQYRNWKSISPLQLFDAPIIQSVPERSDQIKRTLERECRGAQKLIIWTDCDREGENIGFEVIDVVTKVNPRIEVLRARFSEITNNSINRAIANLTQPDNLQNDAVQVRRELDLRIGAAFTRFLTLRYQVAFPELANMLISYGSCQFPTLGFVVERYKQIQEFVPESFWKIKVVLEEDDKKVDFNWKRVRLFDFAAVKSLYNSCLLEPTATVTDVTKKSKSKWRPVALDTVEFEKIASKKLKLSAKEAMAIAERLYTSGYISYPRTETNQFPKDLDLRELIQYQTNDDRWGDFSQRILQNGINPRNGNKSDQAHPPIHPTKHAPNLAGNDGRVYEFIVRHFLACCSDDARGFETSVNIQISTEKFSASGLVILERNYLDVYPYEKWSDKDIPNFQSDTQYMPNSIEIVDGMTSPPNLLTEADLIALMEKHGIGTDATHAEHIEKIQERSYAGVQDRKFLPGKLGMGLVEGYDALGFEFSKPLLRAGLESDLKLICEGRKTKDEVLRDQIGKYRDKFEISMRRVAEIDEQMKQYLGTEMGDPGAADPATTGVQQQVSIRKCPHCGCDMTLRRKASISSDQPTQSVGSGGGYFLGCQGYPQCRSVMWLPKEMSEVTVLDSSCPQCGPDTKRVRIRFQPNSVPIYIGEDYVTCLMCDTSLKDMFHLNIKTGQSTSNFSSNTNNSRNQTPRGGATSQQPRGGGSQRPRGGGSKKSYSTSSLDPPGGTGMLSGNSQPRRAPLSNISSSDNNQPMCLCNTAALLLTVRKEGANQGRQFYKCGNSDACKFFHWADSADVPVSRGTGGTSAPPNMTTQRTYSTQANRDTNYKNDENNSVMCQCSEPAKELTVYKDGPNKGRKFYGCSKPRDQGCGFFQWADATAPTPSTSGRGGENRGGRGGGGPGRSGGRGGGSGKRRCGNCREEGHTKKKCPQL